MKIDFILIFLILLLSACNVSPSIDEIDKTLNSSSKSLGNVDLINDITKQNSVIATPKEDGNIKLNYDDEENVTQRASETKTQNTPTPKTLTTVEDLAIKEIKVGTGVEAQNEKKVTVNYIGTLTNGEEFDNSYKRGQPFTFTLGKGEVIKGWDVGVLGMKEGGKRHLEIPAKFAYGNQAVGDIPAGASLIFEVELLKVE